MRVLWILVASVALLQDTQTQEPKGELAAATDKVVKAASYSFESEILFGMAGAEAQEFVISGRYEKGKGTYVKVEDVGNFVRRGDRVLVQFPGDDWMLFDAKEFEGDVEAQMLAQMQAPHEELKGFEKRFNDLKKTDETEQLGEEEATLFKGEVTEKGAKQSLPFKLEAIQRFLTDATYEGTASGWVGEKGHLLKYVLETRINGSFGGGDQPLEFQVEIERKVELSKINETRADIPEEALELLKPKKEENED